LFHIAAVNRLRVYVNVPQVYSPHIKPGLKAELTLAEFPGRHFQASSFGTPEQSTTRAAHMLTEIDVNNPSGELKPGGYAEVHLNLALRGHDVHAAGEHHHIQVGGHAGRHSERRKNR